MTPAPTLADALRRLQADGVPRLEAQQLVLLAAGHDPHDRAWLATHDDHPLDDKAQARLDALATRWHSAEPMAYLRGEQAFRGLALRVDARVLVPRPDTETLVDWALERIADLPAAGRVIDLGTGSGAIALALKQAAPRLDVWATDRSADALSVARANAERLDLPLQWAQGAWFEAVAGERFHLAVSNPPYIAADDPHLPALRHEPRGALVAGADGLDDLRTLIQQAPEHLHPDGWLLLEHGHDQAPAVRALLRDAGYADVGSRNDLAGIARCTGGRWPGAR